MTRHAGVMLFVLTLLTAACGRDGRTPAAGPTKAKTPSDQVVLSADEQRTGKIETEAVTATDAPELLRVSGRIARADDRTWRVGVRTNGLVTREIGRASCRERV